MRRSDHKLIAKPSLYLYSSTSIYILVYLYTSYFYALFCRLLPLYGGIILITVAYQNYIGFGPFSYWFDGKYAVNPCDKNWWTNLLYINNFVNNGGDQMVRLILPIKAFIFVVLLCWIRITVCWSFACYS